MSSYNTVLLKGEIGRHYEEALAKSTETITPGMLVQLHTDGTIKVHAGDGLSGDLMVAIEDALQGKTISDNYLGSVPDLVRYIQVEPGDELQMILKDGQTSVIGGPLSSNGDGKLRVGVSGTDALLFSAKEVVAASGSDARVWVKAGPRART